MDFAVTAPLSASVGEPTAILKQASNHEQQARTLSSGGR
jgi:hypothetical protein